MLVISAIGISVPSIFWILAYPVDSVRNYIFKSLQFLSLGTPDMCAILRAMHLSFVVVDEAKRYDRNVFSYFMLAVSMWTAWIALLNCRENIFSSFYNAYY